MKQDGAIYRHKVEFNVTTIKGCNRRDEYSTVRLRRNLLPSLFLIAKVKKKNRKRASKSKQKKCLSQPPLYQRLQQQRQKLLPAKFAVHAPTSDASAMSAQSLSPLKSAKLRWKGSTVVYYKKVLAKQMWMACEKIRAKCETDTLFTKEWQNKKKFQRKKFSKGSVFFLGFWQQLFHIT